ncbi:AAA family ATPase [Mucilaginibacter sp.]|uniref:AAA family ATPase n=1 Tax=Mucilaginibacter sp. TaxID=1882438 RepID=UPI0025D226FF|nr:AAA family ATPase [Mucilaginibacter sp.]
MKKSSKYQLKHLSIRVPWHDNKWNGTICKCPSANNACLALKNCALNRDDEREDVNATKSIENLIQADFPPCVGERATFMAPFSFTKKLDHPYVEVYPKSHGHLESTPLLFPAFSANSVPYRWMSKKSNETFIERFELDYDEAREPDLINKYNGNKENSKWVQESNNQKALLNGFYEHLEADISLVFFYAKQMPFVEDSGKVLVGVGRINRIIESEPYRGSNKRFSASYWEHMILHSIRPDCSDGFLLPYHDAIEYQKEHPDFDPSILAVKTPEDKALEFSYASEHVATDTAIRVLYQCVKSIEQAKILNIGLHHDRVLVWIHDEVARLEKLRGDYPGMGAALCGFGIEKGHFVAAEISSVLQDGQCAWDLFERVISGEKNISKETTGLITPSIRENYLNLKGKADSARIDLLHLLSRFDISIEQAKILYVHEERTEFDSDVTDKDILTNPYLLYEITRRTSFPISLLTVDIGLFSGSQKKKLLPTSIEFNDPLDNKRIRALTIYQLENATLQGHTLLPRKFIIKNIRDMSLQPKCEVNSDYYESAEKIFTNEVGIDVTKKGETAYQLSRLQKSSEIIRSKVKDRLRGKRLELSENWKFRLDEKIKADQIKRFGKVLEPDEDEERARFEKASCLLELANARFSVLIGPAGTGKTTLLSVLAQHPLIEANGVLLLAPTGKARVRMEEVIKGTNITTATLARFLRGFGRYIGDRQQYVLSNKYSESGYETVIIDECSMLTEEMLATTLDCFRGVKRFILVGDHRQLPPIGPGRPFYDIINFLRPENEDELFPKVSPGYAELTIRRRQGGTNRDDLQLAEWFSGNVPDPAADDIFQKIQYNENSDFLRLEKWENEGDFEQVFNKVLAEELNIFDTSSFNLNLGSSDGTFFNSTSRAKAFEVNPSVDFIEKWQILSPIKDRVFGVQTINRKLHQKYRAENIHTAVFGKKVKKYNGEEIAIKNIPKPLGLEQIVYGDKVINVGNHSRNDVYPDDGMGYLANGEIGIVVGQYKSKTDYKKYSGQPQYVKIEFSSQKGYEYTFKAFEFTEEGQSPLELAYALTVHKAQGSEFEKVFFVLPNPCFLLKREMLYTALTRQTGKVIVLYQGNLFDVKALSNPIYSDTLSRITNLFEKPDMVEVDGIYLERNLIHQASDGRMLRSKSELHIYQRLLDKGLTPIYEKPLIIKDVEKLPDFTLENDDTGINYYWEHCGVINDKGYDERWDSKYKWYIENDILPFEQGGGDNGTLIVTKDKPKTIEDGSTRGAISILEIDKIISDIFGR